ncbi:hypothetical protein DXG01_002258 [Tephrocybe rancida]|nr:hypothetical protein DXG01_002258 [Tephrocybe rancida]
MSESRYPPISLQPETRESMVYAAEYAELPDQQDLKTQKPPSHWPILAKLQQRAARGAHIGIAKALLTPPIATACLVFGHFLLRVAYRLEDEYKAPLYLSALAGFIGGQCMLGWVIILITLVEDKSSSKRWYRHITLLASLVIFAASVAAGPVGVMIVGFEGRSNSDILHARRALCASGLGAAILFGLLFVVMTVVYAGAFCAAMEVAGVVMEAVEVVTVEAALYSVLSKKPTPPALTFPKNTSYHFAKTLIGKTISGDTVLPPVKPEM